MGQACVNCHTLASPTARRRTGSLGDVRGIQEISIRQPIAANIFSFKYLLAYLVLAAVAGLTFILVQRKQAAAHCGQESRTRGVERLPRVHLDEDREVSLAANLQEHLLRPARRRDFDRTKKAHDLLLRHQGFHLDHRAPAAGRPDGASERILHRDVGDRPQARRHRRQVHRRRDGCCFSATRKPRASPRTRALVS